MNEYTKGIVALLVFFPLMFIGMTLALVVLSNFAIEPCLSKGYDIEGEWWQVKHCFKEENGKLIEVRFVNIGGRILEKEVGVYELD